MDRYHAHTCHHDHVRDPDRAASYGQIDPSARPVGRRALLAGVGGLLMLAAMPGTARAAHATMAGSSVPLVAAARSSKLTQGTTLVHADMHNHTVMSDGDGSADAAFASMREAGLDVAALT